MFGSININKRTNYYLIKEKCIYCDIVVVTHATVCSSVADYFESFHIKCISSSTPGLRREEVSMPKIITSFISQDTIRQGQTHSKLGYQGLLAETGK